MRNPFALVMLVAAVALGAHVASAQTLEDRLRDQLRATVQQVQQLQDQQATFQAQMAAITQERDALKAQLAAAKAQKSHTNEDRGQVQALTAQVAQYKEAASQAAATATQAQADHDKLTAGLAGAQNLLGACQTKNGQLLKVGTEILDAYQNFDFGDALGANEPFIGTKRVELENLAQDFGDQLHDGKFDPRAVHPATQPAAQSSTQTSAQPPTPPSAQPSQESHK
jgi:septal ring factor EnvC (AmiA/AmiB activator)